MALALLMERVLDWFKGGPRKDAEEVSWWEESEGGRLSFMSSLHASPV